jgi:hypothetical protein
MPPHLPVHNTTYAPSDHVSSLVAHCASHSGFVRISAEGVSLEMNGRFPLRMTSGRWIDRCNTHGDLKECVGLNKPRVTENARVQFVRNVRQFTVWPLQCEGWIRFWAWRDSRILRCIVRAHHILPMTRSAASRLGRQPSHHPQGSEGPSSAGCSRTHASSTHERHRHGCREGCLGGRS